MKLWNVFRVTLREQLRSPWDLLLVLLLGPGMVALYWSFFGGGGSTNFTLLVLNQDSGVCAQTAPAQSCADQAIAAMQAMKYTDGAAMLKVKLVESREQATPPLQNREAAALVVFPSGFTGAIQANREGATAAGPARITLVGDLGNPYYTLAAVLATTAVDAYAREAVGARQPLEIAEEPLSGAPSVSEFEIYVPGLIIAATTMMIFSVAIAVTRQVETGTLRRLQLSRMTGLDFLGGISLFYLVVAFISVALTFATAQALGFQSRGALWVAMLICTLTSFAVIGVGLLVACFSRTVARAAVVVNFPLIVLLFFSGSVFPVPDATLFHLAGRSIGIFDLLPHTHAVLALNKVLSLGAGLGDVAFELVAMLLLSMIYFAAGVWFFRKMHLSPQ
jgi:ABC-2 type transport system permease protein